MSSTKSKPFVTRARYMKAISGPMKTAIDRNKRYGNSIDIVKDDTIIDLVLMKLVRTRELPADDKKRYDEVQDSINYLVYLLMRNQR